MAGAQSEGSLPRAAADFYATPECSTRALLGEVDLPHYLWEPACGDGAISRVLIAAGHPVRSTDLHPHGFGESGIDFLKTPGMLGDGIVTNPPLSLANQFIAHAIDLRSPVTCLFLRLAALEGIERARFWPWLHRVVVFSDRQPVWRHDDPRRAIGKAGGLTAYAWFVFHGRRTHADPTIRFVRSRSPATPT
jgi:hypothetical protein